MSEPKNKKSLETGSGILWGEWLVFLEPYAKLNHTYMAEVVLEKIRAVGVSKSPEWWAQGVTVAYEQHIGRRKIGQTCDGLFSVTVTTTRPGAMDDVLSEWVALNEDPVEYNGLKVDGTPRISETKKWRYWRLDFTDGSKLSVNVQTKPDGAKSMLAINHDKLQSAGDVELWRTFWKDCVKKMGDKQ